MGMILQQLVRGFAGEDRLHADDLLQPNVSPDALNNDYARGTIRKRKGYAKLHSDAILEGGVLIDNTASAKCIWIPNLSAYIMTGDFTIEVFVKIVTMPTADVEIMTMYEIGVGGWILRLLATGAFRGQLIDGISATRVKDTPVIAEAGKRHHLAFFRDTNTIAMYHDGTETGSLAATGMDSTTRPIFVGAGLGATPQNQTIAFVIDEIRIWNDRRTLAELDASTSRELNAGELDDANLIGYWRLNEASWNICEDLSVKRNHGTFDEAGPSFEKGLVPNQSEDGYAIRFDGVDDVAQAAYNAAWAPILDTGDTWTIEGWCRLDKDTGSASFYLVTLGSPNDGNGSAFAVFIDSSLNLKYKYSTTTTDSNVEVDTTYNVVVGQQFHFAIVRNGTSIFSYINGELVDTVTVADENGPQPTPAAGIGMGALTTFAAITLDDVRLWKSARSQTQIQDNLATEFSDTKNSDLVGYWRFNAADKELDETQNSDLTLNADGDKPQWSEGLVFPQTPPRMLMVAPFAQPQRSDEVRSGINPFRREIIAATSTGFWKIAGGDIVKLRDFAQDKIGGNGLFDWAMFQDKLIWANGLEDNSKYDGGESPTSVTIDTPTAEPTEALAGSGSGWTGSTGDHKYRYAFRNAKDGTESLGSDPSDAATVVSATDTVDLSDIEVSADPQVTHVRIYRLDPNSTVYRFLADIETGTTTYSDTGTAITANEAINDLRGHLNPYRYCAVYQNRLWFLNTPGKPSSLVYSEPDTYDFPASNDILVDRGDGDEGTGIWAAFGGLVVFKQHAIHFLTGQGATTFQIHKIVQNQGCSAGQTIAQSPRGLYFLGADGVYLFDGQSVQYMSETQQTEFIKMLPDQRRFAVGAYDPETHQYLISFDAGVKEAGAYVDVQPNLFTNYWKLNGAVVDSAGSDDLTLNGDPNTIIDSQRGTAYRLDGTGDFFDVDKTLPTGVYTVGIWFTFHDIDANSYVYNMESDGGGVFGLLKTGKVIDIFHGQTASNAIITFIVDESKKDQWLHLIFVKQAFIITAYLNGDVIGRIDTDGTTGAPSGTEQIIIGNQRTNPFLELDGNVQNAWLIDGVALTEVQAKEIYDYENHFGFLNPDETTMVFDEQTQSWAKWDRRFDYLSVGEHSENRAEVFAAKNGFLHKLFEGATDGGSLLEGSTVVASGSVSANSTATITDSGAVFATQGNGLAGATVTVKSSADTTEQKRLIIANTATDLYLDRPLSPAITGTYYVAPIDWYWESPWMDMNDTFLMKRWRLLWLHLKETSATVTFRWKTTEHETWAEQTFSTADEIMRLSIPARGRKLKIRFEHILPNLDVEIESFQAAFTQRRLV